MIASGNNIIHFAALLPAQFSSLSQRSFRGAVGGQIAVNCGNAVVGKR
jgi:hypothetical protein